MPSAPQTSIETVLHVRVIKVGSMFMGIIALICLTIGAATTAWLQTDGYRMGIWETCLNETVIEGGPKHHCSLNDIQLWCWASAVLGCLACLTVFIAIVLNGCGLASIDHTVKYKLYRWSMYLFFFTMMVVGILVVVFPLMFIQTARAKGYDSSTFRWGYFVECAGIVFTFGAAVMLAVSKDKEEIFYEEKTYYPEDNEAAVPDEK